MRFDLPFPPSTNHLYTEYRGRKIISREGRAYKKLVALSLMAQGAKSIPESPRLHVTYTFHHWQRKYGYDVGNFEKALTDAMVEAGLFSDDRQIDAMHLIRGDVVKPRGNVEVEISVIA